MATSTDILKTMHKDHGNEIATRGKTNFKDIARIPTGIFSVDLAMGGGWPVGRCCIVYGPESSNKTNIVLMTIIQAQRMWPKKNVVFVDAENALDLKWVATLGVNMDRLIVVNPEFAEQAVDFLEAFVHATDVSLIVLDSIAALITNNEAESSASKVSVGGASLIIGKMYRKLSSSMRKMTNQGLEAPTFIAINQIRMKIGVMFGNPETMPGGFPPKFYSSMTLRVYGKNIIDKKLSTVMPAQKEVNAVIQKWKCPILAINAVYTMQMIEAGGNKPGYINDWNTVSSYMKELDYLGKGANGKGWDMGGVNYPTLEACKEALYSDPDALADMKNVIIQELIAGGSSIEASGEIPTEEVESS